MRGDSSGTGYADAEAYVLTKISSLEELGNAIQSHIGSDYYVKSLCGSTYLGIVIQADRE